MKTLYDIVDTFEKDIDKICCQETMSPSDVELVGVMVDVIKDIETIEAMRNSSYGNGYSETYPMDMRNSYANDRGGRGNSYDSYSNRRGRNDMGQYTSRGQSYDNGYSGHDNRDTIVEDLTNAMMNARDDAERERYRKAIDQLKR